MAAVGDRDAPVAAIDLGTNSVRLLIQRGPEVLARETAITRLGEGIGRDGRLRPDAIERTVEQLHAYRRMIDDHQVRRVRVVATEAMRAAPNATEACAEIEARVGFGVEVISSAEEGRLAFAGATAGHTADASSTLVIDVGGGSTEFVFGHAEVEGSISLPLGSIRLTERFIEGDPPRAEDLSACISYVETYLDDVSRTIPEAHDADTFVGLAGTIVTMARVELGQHDYNRDELHGFVLDRAAAEDVFRTLVTERLGDRIHNPGLPRERADTIVGGCCLVVATMRFFGIDELVVRESDLLDAIVAELQSAD